MRRKHTDDARASRVELSHDRNPLVRRSDRIQSRAKSVVLTLMILTLPLAAWFGMSTLGAQQDRISQQQYTVHPVTAVTTAATEASPLLQSDLAAQNSASVDATWSYLGLDHHDDVSVTIGSPAGTPVAIWVNDDGNRTTQPISGGDAIAAALFTGLGSLLVVALLLYGAYAALRFNLDAKRYAEWDLAIVNFMDRNSLG